MNDVGDQTLHEYVPNRGHGQGDQEQWGNRCLKPGCDLPEQHPVHWVDGPPEEIKTQVIEQIKQQASPPPSQDWLGDNPFWLRFDPKDAPEGNIGIDLDEHGWIEKNRAHMRSEGTWYLISKRTNRPLFTVVIEPGDQFYYAKRHVGFIAVQNVQTVCYGIGKKKADGTPVNLWLLPNGVICGGDDVDSLTVGMLKRARPPFRAPK